MIEGDRMEIIDHPSHDPDWWLARHPSTGQTGLVPRNYIEVEGDLFLSVVPRRLRCGTTRPLCGF